MVICVNTVYIFCQTALRLLFYLADDRIYTADGGNDPDLITCSHLTVRSSVAAKGTGGKLLCFSEIRVIFIAQKRRKIRTYIVGMYVLSLSDIFLCVPDGICILNNILPFGNIV